MKLNQRNIINITILLISAILMAFEFGGNYDTFYNWLMGSANGFNSFMMPDDSIFMVIAWIYTITLLGAVFCSLIENMDMARLCTYVSTGSMSIFVLFGLYGTTLSQSGSFCIGMPLLLIATLALLFTNVTSAR